MVTERPKIAVFGAGMIGLFVGGLLAREADVTFIGRPSMLGPLADGLRLTDVDGLDLRLAASDFTLSTDAGALACAQLVLVTVKSLATGDAAAAIAAHARGDALVISVQNGLSNPDVLRAEAGSRRVLAGMVPFNVAQLGPVHFHRGTGGGLVVEADSALDAWEPVFASAGIALQTSPNILGVQWGKLLVNLNNAINAVSGVSLANELRQRDYRRAWALSMAEALPLLKAAGIEPVDPLPMPLKLMPQIMRLPDPLYRYVLSAGSGGKVKVDPHARSSMADDLGKGRKTEVDFLQGEVVRLAERLGRKAPVNARMVELVKAAEGGAGPISATALYADLQAARR